MYSRHHKLVWPIKGDDDKKIDTVTIRPLTVSERLQLDKASAGNDKKLTRDCIIASTGLSAAEVKRLIKPDLTSIQQLSNWLMQSTATQVIEHLKSRITELHEQIGAEQDSSAVDICAALVSELGIDESEVERLIGCPIMSLMVGEHNPKPAPERIVLLSPIAGDSSKSSYALKPPSVAAADIMETYPEEGMERTFFISTNCTAFRQAQIEQMALPDWNELQGRLIDFLEKPAEYYRDLT